MALPGNRDGHKLPAIQRFLPAVVSLFLGAAALSACSALSQPAVPTLLPGEYLPTVIAMTLQAAAPAAPSLPPPTHTEIPPSDPAPQTTTPPPPSPTLSAEPSPSPTRSGSVTPTRRPSATPSPTSTPEIPFAEIEIRNLGPLSRVTSPISVQTYFKSGGGGKLQVDLLGEDGRFLYRNLRPVTSVAPGAWVFFVLDIDYEISAAAEAGRLQLSVEDEFGRLIALNSVPLILLSLGEADINPPVDALAPVVIQQPGRKALIQGGTVLVSGMVRPENDLPLVVRLINTKGAEVGSRLASISAIEPGGYARFAVEVPYNVTKLTDVLLVVTMGGSTLNDVVHLTSREIVIGP